MKDYQREILDKLLEKYERSRLYVVRKKADGLAHTGVCTTQSDSYLEQEQGHAVVEGTRNPNNVGRVAAGGLYTILRYSREEFPDYWDESTAEKRQAINLATFMLESEGIIRVQRARWDRDTVERVYLCLERLDDAYEISGRYPRARKEASLEQVVTRWLTKWQTELEIERCDLSQEMSAGRDCREKSSRVADSSIASRVFCLRAGVEFLREFEARLRDCLSLPCGFSLDDGERLEDICKAIDSLSRLTSEMPVRAFSVQVYGNSKRVEEMDGKLARVLSDFGDLNELGLDRQAFSDWSEFKDALLEELGIVSNPVHVFVSGPLTLQREGHVVDLSSFVSEVGLSQEIIQNYEIIDVGTDTVITVENLTPFHMLSKMLWERPGERYLLVYLGGYHNKVRRQFLHKIYQKFRSDGRVPRFLHWGDIDLGGFRIYQHLAGRTGIPIQPLLMGRDTYHKYSAHGKPIAASYRKKIEALLGDPEYQVFHDVIEAILEQGVVVEQESIDVVEVLANLGRGFPGSKREIGC